MCRFIDVSVSQTIVHQSHLEGLLKQIAGPIPQVSDSAELGWGQNFTFLISFQVMLMLLVWKPHFKNFDLGNYKGIHPHKV